MDQNGDQRSWWGRNWKWVVPSGGCLLIIILIVLFAGSLFFGVTTMMKDSTPYKEAMALTQENEAVIAALGEPIETSGMLQGNINTSGNTGSVDLRIPLEGPEGKGILFVVADRTGEVWTYHRLEVVITKTNEVIGLRPGLPD